MKISIAMYSPVSSRWAAPVKRRGTPSTVCLPNCLSTSLSQPPAVSSDAPTKPSGDRKTALEAIQKPTSSDPGEDAYLYGYRLWEAKFYPEAQAQLKIIGEIIDSPGTFSRFSR